VHSARRSLSLSFIAVTYYSAPVIGECLGSILRTAPGDAEIIVVDNARTDDAVTTV
jgi:GT2 family glycosyltransferase